MIERNEYLKNLISFKDKNLIKVITGIHAVVSQRCLNCISPI